MTVQSESQKLTQDTVVRLVTIEYGTGQVLRYTNSIEDPNTTVFLNGNEFFGRSFSLTNFEVKAGGSLPRPVLSLDNIDRAFYSIVVNNDFLIGASVLYQEVYASNLDGGSNPDPSQILISLQYNVLQMTRLHRQEFRIKLATPLDLEQVQFGRQILRNTCSRPYRSPDPSSADTFIYPTNSNVCPYGLASRPGTGSNYFTKDGTPTADWRQDDCGQFHSECVRRFGTIANLPFQGAPSIGRV